MVLKDYSKLINHCYFMTKQTKEFQANFQITYKTINLWKVEMIFKNYTTTFFTFPHFS